MCKTFVPKYFKIIQCKKKHSPRTQILCKIWDAQTYWQTRRYWYSALRGHTHIIFFCWYKVVYNRSSKAQIPSRTQPGLWHTSSKKQNILICKNFKQSWNWSFNCFQINAIYKGFPTVFFYTFITISIKYIQKYGNIYYLIKEQLQTCQ
jgi:hypothetical protein